MPRLPALKPKEIIRALETAGFVVHHQVGSHAQLKHPTKPGLRVTVPVHGFDVPRHIVQSILRQAEITSDEFLKLL